MARNGSGTYSRLNGVAPAARSVASSTNYNAEIADIATELTDSLSRSGKGAMLADLPAGANSILFDERSAPSSPAANKLAVYAADDGGITKLWAKDSFGTVTSLMSQDGPSGSTGSSDNAILRADGTGGSTFQASSLLLDDTGSLTFPEMSAPSTPGAGKVALYAKSDGMFYEKDDTGAERRLTSVGKSTIGLPAGAFSPAFENGCTGPSLLAVGTNKINFKYLIFANNATQYAWSWLPMPKSYNGSTLTARFIWAHPSGASAFVARWQIEMLSYSNADTIDLPLGSAVTVDSTGGVANSLYISSVTSAITPGNSAGKSDWLAVRVARLGADAADTLTSAAYLIGVEIYYTSDAATDD